MTGGGPGVISTAHLQGTNEVKTKHVAPWGDMHCKPYTMSKHDAHDAVIATYAIQSNTNMIHLFPTIDKNTGEQRAPEWNTGGRAIMQATATT